MNWNKLPKKKADLSENCMEIFDEIRINGIFVRSGLN